MQLVNRIGRRPGWVVSCAVAALALAGGIAYAGIQESDGIIHGCYQKEHGQLRVVGAVDDCTGGELAISWNHGGPPGPAGAPGQPGTSGTTNFTRITWNNGGTDVVGDTTPQLIDTAGTFTKAQASTTLKLTWQGALYILAPNFQTCRFFLEVDSQRGQVEAQIAVFGEGASVDPVTLIDYFDGLPPGRHTITIWERSPFDHPRCGSNAGGWPETMFVEEIPRVG
jgi:hypothetical protein